MGLFDRSRNGLANRRSHAPADKRIFHGADNHRAAVQLAAGVDDCIFKAGVGLGPLQARGVRFQVDKLQRVGGGEIAVENVVLTVVEKLRQAGAGVNAKVFVALRTDVEIVFQVLFPDNLAAAVALYPQAFGAYSFLARRVQLPGLSLEPSHKEQFSSRRVLEAKPLRPRSSSRIDN